MELFGLVHVALILLSQVAYFLICPQKPVLGSAQLANFLKQLFNFSNTSSSKFYRLLPGKENTVLCVLPPKKNKLSCNQSGCEQV